MLVGDHLRSTDSTKLRQDLGEAELQELSYNIPPVDGILQEAGNAVHLPELGTDLVAASKTRFGK